MDRVRGDAGKVLALDRHQFPTREMTDRRLHRALGEPAGLGDVGERNRHVRSTGAQGAPRQGKIHQERRR